MDMKPSSAAKPLSRSNARNCFLINQLATPGLGSVMGRRFLAGACQLLLAVTGFVLLLVWMCQFFYYRIMQAAGEPVTSKPIGRIGEWGLICFGAAWIWSLFTSISLLRNVEPEPQPPPRISDVAPENQTGSIS